MDVLTYAGGVATGVLLMLFLSVFLLTKLKGPRDRLIHRIDYKRYHLTCPRCNGVGWTQPTSPLILQQVGSKEPPRFECPAPPIGCDGTGKVVYEFPREYNIEISEEGRLISDAPDEHRVH